MKTTAIIPAYNESETVGRVVRVAMESGILDEVIVVSDGSTDDTAERARAAGATVYELKPNRGKGGAMRYGAEKSKAEIILFLDADLRGLKTEHIKALLAPVLEGRLAMAVGIRDRGPVLSRLARHLPLIGGERAMRKTIFKNIPEKFLRGFMAEIAMNYYCRSRKLRYGTVFLKGLNMRKKMEKAGILRGLGQYIKMSWQIIKAMVIVRWGKIRGKF